MPALPTDSLLLECFPPLPGHVALPRDAADDYLIAAADPAVAKIIINDRFGVLACAFPSARLWSDSFSARRSWDHNLTLNQLPPAASRTVANLTEVGTDTRQVLLRIPKALDQLCHWLDRITAAAPDAEILLAGMAKHIPVSWLKHLQQNSSGYEQLRIERKARLMRLRGWKGATRPAWRGYTSQDGLHMSALPGVFSGEKEDAASRLLLDLVTLPESGCLIDLGCGNGLLALTAAHRTPALTIIACDDSAAAVESAQHNARQNHLTLAVRQSDCLSEVSETADIILCNPPFHDGHRQLTDIAARMFTEAAQHLSPDGSLMVVANRHLPYLPLLRQYFREVKPASSHPKFTVYACRRPK